MSVPYDWRENGFDEEQWEDIINSDELFAEQFSESINPVDNSNVIVQKKDIIKLSANDFQSATFLNSEKLLYIGRSMKILIPPSSNQRVRYENECKRIFRYISIPNNGTLTIEIPDLRDICMASDVLWMRITRTTIDHRNDHLIFYHPYPIWIKNKSAKIHNGSILIPITNKDMEDGLIQIDTLAMIRLKQGDLGKINTLAIYSPTQLNFVGIHLIETETAKRIRDVYELRQSILNFQLVRVDQNNLAYPTDCLCQTESLYELEASEQHAKVVQFHEKIIKKSKKTNWRKKV